MRKAYDVADLGRLIMVEHSVYLTYERFNDHVMSMVHTCVVTPGLIILAYPLLPVACDSVVCRITATRNTDAITINVTD
jgi:hypothetical protein